MSHNKVRFWANKPALTCIGTDSSSILQVFVPERWRPSIFLQHFLSVSVLMTVIKSPIYACHSKISHRFFTLLRSADFEGHRLWHSSFSYSSDHSVNACALWCRVKSSWDEITPIRIEIFHRRRNVISQKNCSYGVDVNYSIRES